MNAQRLQDELAVLQCQQGDPLAFERLVQHWQQPLLNCALRLTGNAEAAQDAVQETWMVVVRNIAALKEVTRFKPWLYRVLSNKCQDHWRKHYLDQQAIDSAEQPHEATTPSTHSRPDIIEAFRHLTQEGREVLTLMYLEDFSVAEIAEIAGVPEGTVKSRLHHARQDLRKWMER